LSHVHPSAFADDLFLKYGSQDSFSVFGPVLAPALAHFSPETTNLCLTVVAELVWLVAAISLVIVLFSAWTQRFLCLGFLFVLPSDYAGAGVFHYAEAFFSPRPFAEAAIMFAIAAFLRERWIACSTACLIALLVHPLMAAPGFFLIFCLIAAKDRRWWAFPAIGTIGFIFLATADVEPFTRLKDTMSGDWLTIVMDRCRWTFFSEWTPWDIVRLVIQASIVSIAWRGMSRRARQLFFATGLTIAAGSLATAIGADLIHNLLIINLQPTRVFWLSSVFANLTAGAALYRLFTDRSVARWHLTTGLAIYALSYFLVYLAALALVPLLVANVLVWRERTSGTFRAFYRRTAFLLTSAAAEISVVLLVMTFIIFARDPVGYFGFYELAARCLIAGSAFLLADKRAVPALALGVVAITLAAGSVDRREGWEKVIEGTGPLGQPEELLGDAKNVYWEEGVELMWLRMRRASYYSCLQGSGVMFYRATATEYQRRANALSTINTLDFKPKEGTICPAKSDEDFTGPTSAADISAACRMLPELDMMVLLTKVPQIDVPSWRAPAPRVRLLPNGKYDRPDTYYFYDCRKLRAIGP
jgi:hypothetical protein